MPLSNADRIAADILLNSLAVHWQGRNITEEQYEAVTFIHYAYILYVFGEINLEQLTHADERLGIEIWWCSKRIDCLLNIQSKLYLH